MFKYPVLTKKEKELYKQVLSNKKIMNGIDKNILSIVPSRQVGTDEFVDLIAWFAVKFLEDER